ncbi:restriction endonuclease subunit S [Vibrio parahaemolyticus]|nr:restriction endonuclease subunit S [Vibrio parahaemolyticus]
MSCNWSVKKLGDLVKFTSGGTPSKSNEAYWGGDIPWISASSMDSTRYSESELKVTTEGAKNGTRLVPKDTVLLLVRGGALHNKIPVGITTREVTFNQDVKALVPKTDEITPWYLLFWLISIKKTLLAKVENTGIGAGKLDTKILQELEVPLPPKPELQRLEKFCKALDDKIILNADTNQTLEQMAQAIFKSWFVDFDPVKAKMNGEQPEGMDAATASLFPDKLAESQVGLIPEGWSVNQLSDICKNHSQSYDLKSVDEVVFVNTGDVLEGDFLHKDYSPVVGLPGQAKKAIKEDDILYSEIRPKNKRFAYVDFDVSDYVVSTKFMVIQANEKVHPRLLYMMLTRQNTIDEFNVIADSRSGTFPQITFKAISNLEFCMAPRKVQDAFVAQVMPMIQLQRSLKTENKRLAELRDTLLPKLLSGEIELDVERVNAND